MVLRMMIQQVKWMMRINPHHLYIKRRKLKMAKKKVEIIEEPKEPEDGFINEPIDPDDDNCDDGSPVDE